MTRCLIDRTPGDVFVHTWDTLNYGGSTWHGDAGLASTAVDSGMLQKLTDQYGVFAKLEVEHPPDFPVHLMPLIQARYSCWRANALKAGREKELRRSYDIVLNIRFDLVMHDPFDFPVPIERGVLYCLGNRNCVSQNLCCDILNFASSRTMDTINDLYAGLRDGTAPEADISSGERFMTKWCGLHNIPFRYVPARCSILRTDGSQLDIPG